MKRHMESIQKKTVKINKRIQKEEEMAEKEVLMPPRSLMQKCQVLINIPLYKSLFRNLFVLVP